MNDTPRATRRRTRLSLSLNKRRKDPAPISLEEKATLPSAPPVTCLGIEPKQTTPPQKQINFDDSNLDDSASSLDGSFSPSAFLSQTLSNSPKDVGWSWEKDFARDFPLPENIRKLMKTYLSENNNDEARCEIYRKRYFAKRNERRRARDLQLHKAEKARASALWKERMAKWESQKKDISEIPTAAPKRVNDELMITDGCENNGCFTNSENTSAALLRTCTTDTNMNGFEINADEPFDRYDDFGDVFDDSIRIDDNNTPPTAKSNVLIKESFDDFFNDSDMDGLLIEATQKIESSQPTPEKHDKRGTNSGMQSEASKEKHSSFYKDCFGDDDDDFFVSLDESWLQKVSQQTKPRSPFARYKSMPTTTTATATKPSSTVTTGAGSSNSSNVQPNKRTGNSICTTSPSPSHHSIKRHASSHAISSSSTNYRGRQMHRRD